MFQRNLAIIFLGIFGFALQAEAETYNVSFSLYATDLSGCDDLSKCDSFVNIFCQSKLSDWHKCGQTSALQDNNFPLWPEVFTFEHDEDNREYWQFKLMDEDVAFNDEMAVVEASVNEFVTATETSSLFSLTLDGKTKGKLTVKRVRNAN